MPANQNNWEGNHRWIGMWNSWSLILQCVYDVSLWMMMCSEEKGNCPFQHLCTAVWNAYDNVILKSCGLLGRVGIRGAQTIFNPNLDEDSCMMYSEKKNKKKKPKDFLHMTKYQIFSPFHICQPVSNFFVCYMGWWKYSQPQVFWITFYFTSQQISW